MTDVPPALDSHDWAEGLSVQEWPTVVYTGPNEPISDPQMRRVIDEMGKIREQDLPYGLLLDLRETKGLTATQRKMITDSMKDHEATDTCYGVAMVFDSTVLKGILTAIFWIRRPARPTQVFAQPADARLWLRKFEFAPHRQKPLL